MGTEDRFRGETFFGAGFQKGGARIGLLPLMPFFVSDGVDPRGNALFCPGSSMPFGAIVLFVRYFPCFFGENLSKSYRKQLEKLEKRVIV